MSTALEPRRCFLDTTLTQSLWVMVGAAYFGSPIRPSGLWYCRLSH
jgi:hypothetical protein